MMTIPPLLKARLEAPFEPQPAFAWPRERWQRWFPDEPVCGTLDDRLSRETVATGVRESLDSGQVRDAFFAVMVWGTGFNNRGAGRAHRILTSEKNGGLPRVDQVLAEGAERAQRDDAVSVFFWMNNDGRLHEFGPSFFTKWLSFTSVKGDVYGPATAPILDNRVIGWLATHADTQLRANRTDDYRRYLEILKAWGVETSRTVAQVERDLFQLTWEN